MPSPYTVANALAVDLSSGALQSHGFRPLYAGSDYQLRTQAIDASNGDALDLTGCLIVATFNHGDSNTQTRRSDEDVPGQPGILQIAIDDQGTGGPTIDTGKGWMQLNWGHSTEEQTLWGPMAGLCVFDIVITFPNSQRLPFIQGQLELVASMS